MFESLTVPIHGFSDVYSKPYAGMIGTLLPIVNGVLNAQLCISLSL